MRSRMCGGEMESGQVYQEQITVIAQSWPNAACCWSYGRTVNAWYSAVPLPFVVPGSVIVLSDVKITFDSRECPFG
jgi:hypothetical protein